MAKANHNDNHAKPIIRKPYGQRLKVIVKMESKSMTDQSFKDECDINFIMDKYLQTGEYSHVNHNRPVYIDCPAGDYLQALEVIQNAEQAFEEMPSAIRDRFQNDPSQLLSFLDDANNRNEAVELGLVNPPKKLETMNAQEQAVQNHQEVNKQPEPQKEVNKQPEPQKTEQ